MASFALVGDNQTIALLVNGQGFALVTGDLPLLWVPQAQSLGHLAVAQISVL